MLSALSRSLAAFAMGAAFAFVGCMAFAISAAPAMAQDLPQWWVAGLQGMGLLAVIFGGFIALTPSILSEPERI